MMEINYLILVHNHPTQLARLVKRLSTSDVRFYIHVDLKSEIGHFISVLPASSQVVYINHRINCIWGDISMVNATINGLQQIVSDNRRGYTILMSGQDYPLKSNQIIQDFFSQNYGVNFISMFSLPTKNWADERDGLNRVEYYKLNISDRRADIRILPPLLDSRLAKLYFASQSENILSVLDKYLEMLMHPRPTLNYITQFYGGSQWWAFPIETIWFILEFIDKHPDYTDFFRFSFVPDELFFHTIIGNLPELSTRVKETVTYVDWVSNGPFRPAVFDSSFYDQLIERNELFARKFEADSNSIIFDQLDRYIDKLH